MMWKVKRFVRQYWVAILAGLMIFTGYSHITGGGGSLGRMVRSNTRWMYKVPVVGSMLRSGRSKKYSYLSFSGSRRYSKAAKYSRRKAYGKRGRRRRR